MFDPGLEPQVTCVAVSFSLFVVYMLSIMNGAQIMRSQLCADSL